MTHPLTDAKPLFPAMEGLVARYWKADDKVIHVYKSGGNHCLVVNGTRGEWTSYETMAVHPAGYCAVTDYCSGTLHRPYSLMDVQRGGRVYRLADLEQWATTQTVPPAFDYLDVDNMKFEEAHEGFRWFDEQFDIDIPHAEAERIETWMRDHMAPELKKFREEEPYPRHKTPKGFDGWRATAVLDPEVVKICQLAVDPPKNDK
jgi:hypothetical protein